jgi:hypothetical protein
MWCTSALKTAKAIVPATMQRQVYSWESAVVGVTEGTRRSVVSDQYRQVKYRWAPDDEAVMGVASVLKLMPPMGHQQQATQCASTKKSVLRCVRACVRVCGCRDEGRHTHHRHTCKREREREERARHERERENARAFTVGKGSEKG